MNTRSPWKYGSVFFLMFALLGCHGHYSDDDSSSDTSTQVACSSDSFCDPTSLTCTATFDEIFTTFIDTFGSDFDRFTTITEDTVVTRIDDVDETLDILASEQTETFIVTTTADEKVYRHNGEVHFTSTTTEERVVTTWTQACPTCEVEVCTTSNDDPLATCSFTTVFPAFPQCET